MIYDDFMTNLGKSTPNKSQDASFIQKFKKSAEDIGWGIIIWPSDGKYCFPNRDSSSYFQLE